MSSDGRFYLAVYDALEQPPTDGDPISTGYGLITNSTARSPTVLEPRDGSSPVCSSITGCNRIGVAFSLDGVTWKHSALVAVQTAKRHPCGQIRTPLGLAPEPELCSGCYSVLWTGISDQKGPNGPFRPVCRAVIRNTNEAHAAAYAGTGAS